MTPPRVWFSGDVRVSNEPSFRTTPEAEREGVEVTRCPNCQAILFVGKLVGEIKCGHCRVFVSFGP